MIGSEVSVYYDPEGECLRADRDAEPGEVLLEELPELVVQDSDGGAEVDDEQRCRSAVESFRGLPMEGRAAILGLYCPDRSPPGSPEWGTEYRGNDLRLLRILRVNGICVPGGFTGLYPLAARANHNCRPNAAHCVTRAGHLRFVALAPVRKGEEMAVSYLPDADLLRPGARRRKLLALSWDCQCNCSRCKDPDDARSLACPACGTGRVTFHSSFTVLGAAFTEISRWTSCGQCGSRHPAEALAAGESQWVERYRALPKGARSLGRLRAQRYASASPRAGGGGSTAPADDEVQQGLAELARLDEEISGCHAPAGGAPAPAPEAHWLPATVAGAAAEALLLLGRPLQAASAARRRKEYIRRVLGARTVAHEAAAAVAAEAAALAQAGDEARAKALFEEAISEASKLLRERDPLVMYSRRMLARLGAASGQPADAE